MAPKKEVKKQEATLTAVIVAEEFDRRFLPFAQTGKPWCLQSLCNRPVIDYTLSWLLRTEVTSVILVIKEENQSYISETQSKWGKFFQSFTVVACKKTNSNSIGDAVRELDSRGLLSGDFLLVSNPACITNSTLKKQIENYRNIRAADKHFVMSLICSELEPDESTIIGFEKTTNKLKVYHRSGETTSSMDKPFFIDNTVIRRDLSDTGIAICSMNILAQFGDNFDFRSVDDVIREILVNEEILLQNVHVEILPSSEVAFTAVDYPSFVLLGSLLMERWFYPITPNNLFSLCDDCVVDQNNIYNCIPEVELGRVFSQESHQSVSAKGFNVSLGIRLKICGDVSISNSTIGHETSIGKKSTVFNSVIGNNCVIGEHCLISNSVIGSNVVIPNNTVLPENSIIGDTVMLSQGFVIPPKCAVTGFSVDEDYDELIGESIIDGIHLWVFKDGKPFWTNAQCAGESLDSRAGECSDDDEISGSSSEGDEGELDVAHQFLEEIVDSMTRIQEMERTEQNVRNLILEINSSKLAYNINMHDVAKYVFYAFLGLPGLQSFTAIQQLAMEWKLLFTNYYKPLQSQFHLLMGLEEYYKHNPDFGPTARSVVHFLYQTLDVLEEEAIMDWFESIDTDCDDLSANLKKLMQPIIDWLKTDSEEESDSEED